jgi:hypothetical protein
MRSLRSWTLVMAGLILGLAVAVPIAAQSQKQIKKARKVLEQVKLVDGPGSGLDADTVQGMTPGQVAAGVTPPTPQDTLTALQQVDGAGSGLDADTLRGLAPQQLMGGGAAGLVVRDSAGAFVGAVVGTGFGVEVARQLSGIWFEIEVDEGGFLEAGAPLTELLSYTSPSCTGDQYLQAGSERPLLRNLAIRGGTGYYAAAPVQAITLYVLTAGVDPAICSARGGNPVAGGCCADSYGEPVFAGKVATVDLTTLGLMPPFHLEGPAL